LDLVALKIIERARLPTRIIKNEPEIIWEVLKGKQHGTLITAD
jgi:uridylate kinase